MKNKFKIILFSIVLASVGLAASAQGPFSGFFQPIKNNPVLNMKLRDTTAVKPYTFLFRPKFEVQAIEAILDHGTVIQGDLVAAGPGLGLQHFNKDNYNDWGINAIVFLGANPDNDKMSVKPALTFQAFEIANLGIDYNFTNNKFGLLLGVSIKF